MQPFQDPTGYPLTSQQQMMLQMFPYQSVPPNTNAAYFTQHLHQNQQPNGRMLQQIIDNTQGQIPPQVFGGASQGWFMGQQLPPQQQTGTSTQSRVSEFTSRISSAPKTPPFVVMAPPFKRKCVGAENLVADYILQTLYYRELDLTEVQRFKEYIQKEQR